MASSSAGNSAAIKNRSSVQTLWYRLSLFESCSSPMSQWTASTPKANEGYEVAVFDRRSQTGVKLGRHALNDRVRGLLCLIAKLCVGEGGICAGQLATDPLLILCAIDRRGLAAGLLRHGGCRRII